MGHRIPVRAILVDFWSKNRNEPMGVDAIAEATGLNITQIKVGMNNLLSGNVLPGMRKVVAGHTWSYEPESGAERPKPLLPRETPASASEAPTDKLSAEQKRPTRVNKRSGTSRRFTEVGRTQDGKIIIRDSDGYLYKAEAM